MPDQLFAKIRGRVQAQAPLAPLTTWKIGGPAEFLVIPQDLEDIFEVFALTQRQGLPLFFLGKGSNLLIADAGVPGVTLFCLPGLKNLSLVEMLERTGSPVAGPAHDSPPPPSAAEIVAAYETVAEAVGRAVSAWTDATLEIEDEMYGERWPRGSTLQALVVHQAHHRGQMTVLMRQAGLKVPGVYGPSVQEWTAYGMQPPSV